MNNKRTLVYYKILYWRPVYAINCDKSRDSNAYISDGS